MRDLFQIDIKKLNLKDRRFILSKNSQEYMFNGQMKLNNNILLVSVFALFTSLIILITTSEYISLNAKLISSLILTAGAIYLIFKFIVSTKNINSQQPVIQRGYDELFKLHLAYSKKKD